MLCKVTSTHAVILLIFLRLLGILSFSQLRSYLARHSSTDKAHRLQLAMRLTKAEVREQLKKDFLKKFDSSTADGTNIYACPESLKPLKLVSRYYGSIIERYFIEPDHHKRYEIVPRGYYDLTIPSDTSRGFWDLSRREKIGQKFFQNPLISGIYERGYRQNFENFGFPGIEKEFEEVVEFFTAADATGTVLDLSCGSGFMTRKMVQSERFDRIVAGDLSPSMLAETRRRLLQQTNISSHGSCQTKGKGLPELVRCDSAKLPFLSNSFDAVHAGAAMHCWPQLNQSLAEVFRVLKPGGVFFASTFFTESLDSRDVLKRGATEQGFYLFSSEEEIEDLVETAGFNGAVATTTTATATTGRAGSINNKLGGRCVVRREGNRCAIVKAQKAPVVDGLPRFDWSPKPEVELEVEEKEYVAVQVNSVVRDSNEMGSPASSSPISSSSGSNWDDYYEDDDQQDYCTDDDDNETGEMVEFEEDGDEGAEE